jgi:hypothetical protein
MTGFEIRCPFIEFILTIGDTVTEEKVIDHVIIDIINTVIKQGEVFEYDELIGIDG